MKASRSLEKWARSFAAPQVEFEIGGGAAGADVLAPALSGRLGLSFSRLASRRWWLLAGKGSLSPVITGKSYFTSKSSWTRILY